MSKFEMCKHCLQWGFSDRHRCPPTSYKVYNHDIDDEMILRAWDAESAAMTCAERYDDGEGAHEHEFTVTNLETNEETHFLVTFEHEVTYTAHVKGESR